MSKTSRRFIHGTPPTPASPGPRPRGAVRNWSAALLAASLLTLGGCGLFKAHGTNGESREGLSEDPMAQGGQGAQGAQGAQGPSTAGPKHDIESVAILGTNDIHGTLAPMQLKTREAEGVTPIEYRAGGVAYIASYVRILRDRYGSHFLWLDGGDQFQGSIESNSAQGAPLVEFFNLAGLNASAVGNHEFDFGVPALQSRMAEAHYPYLAANIIDRASGARAPFPNTKAHVILNAGRLKVGVLGLSTRDTPTTTRAENVRPYLFEDLKTATLREAQALRAEGAQLVVITSHVGIRCDRGRSSSAHMLRKSTDPQGECDDDDEMVRLLRSLPAGTIDGVVAGHSHQVVHHWVAGTPVIQAGSNGRYLNVMYLSYDWTDQRAVPERSRIEGPLPVCAAVFQNQNDCNGDRPPPSGEKGGRGPLVPARFRGDLLQPDPAVEAMLAPVLLKTEKIKAEVLGQAARAVEHVRGGESPLGNLIADSLRLSAHTDVALMNPGGIRAPWEAGPITFGDVFRTLPFDNAISKLTLTGRELKLMLRIAESGSRGFFPVSGARLQVIDPHFDAPSSDLDGDKKISTWEINRLLDAKLISDDPDEKPRAIQDDRKYTVATIDFLVTGGDDLGWFMSQIPAERKVVNCGVLARDALVAHLKELAKAGPVNSAAHPFVDTANPRIALKKVEKTGKKGRRRHRSKKRHT